MKPARILFFINGPAPSAKDFQAAQKLNANVVFRNGAAVPADGGLEICDGVAGDVPEPYKFLPTAKEAIEKKQKEVAELAEKTGDTPAPAAGQIGYGSTFRTLDPGNPDAELNAANGPTAVGGAKPNPAGDNAPATAGTVASPAAAAKVWGAKPATAPATAAKS